MERLSFATLNDANRPSFDPSDPGKFSPRGPVKPSPSLSASEARLW